MRGLTVPLLLCAALALADRGRVQRDVRTKLFSTAVVCRTCHSNGDDSGAMRDNQGRGISPHDLWRSSMMANSARDPFFRAALAAEMAASPRHREAISARCLHCHAPMASYEARAAGKPGLTFKQLENEFEEADWDVAALARDGVSCTLCHQIQPGAEPDGEFKIADDREIYGPFDKQFGLAMHRITKYWPVQGKHVLESEHCATCHSSTLPGETTFLEWRNSSRAKTCQGCHMPSGERTRIARTSHGGDIANLPPRTPVGRHLFVGGNTLVPKILRDNIDALHVKAPPASFDKTIAAARALLREQTARVSINGATREGDKLHIVVVVENLTGHKFPTGHTSRRAWLRLRVRDSKGRVVFASGETDAKGRLLGGPGVHACEEAGGPLMPHRTELSTGQIQIYEAVQKGSRVLTHGAQGLVKDNRLLPAGWDEKHRDAARTKPVGIGGDDDFVAGGDTVVYNVPFPENELPYTVEVALLYQPLSPRYLAELALFEDPEVARFVRFCEAAGNAPELIARAKLVVAE